VKSISLERCDLEVQVRIGDMANLSNLWQLIDVSAVGYIGQPEDVASTVSYLASKEAHYITGKSTIENVPNMD